MKTEHSRHVLLSADHGQFSGDGDVVNRDGDGFMLDDVEFNRRD